MPLSLRHVRNLRLAANVIRLPEPRGAPSGARASARSIETRPPRRRIGEVVMRAGRVVDAVASGPGGAVFEAAELGSYTRNRDGACRRGRYDG